MRRAGSLDLARMATVGRPTMGAHGATLPCSIARDASATDWSRYFVNPIQFGPNETSPATAPDRSRPNLPRRGVDLTVAGTTTADSRPPSRPAREPMKALRVWVT
jgi:hypothetical protein